MTMVSVACLRATRNARLEGEAGRHGRRHGGASAGDRRPGEAHVTERNEVVSDAGAAPLPRNLGGLTVLVVDDDAATVEYFAMALTHCGARVTVASSASEGLTRMRDVRPDVVLTDIAMRGEDGYWLVREIRKLGDAALNGVPVVATTAYGREHSGERTRAAGFIAHLAKPVDPEVLCRTIGRAAGRA